MDQNQAVSFEVRYPESSSRLLALLGVFWFPKAILLIPHFIILFALGFAAGITNWIAQWAILFTGHYPKGLFDFGVGVQRWGLRADAWMKGRTDRYPPFDLN